VEFRVAKRSLRFDQVRYFSDRYVDDGIFCGEPGQSSTESKPLVEIWRAVPSGLRPGEIGFGGSPGCVEQLLCFSEKSGRQVFEWIVEALRESGRRPTMMAS
jgi:hypothetical protein